MAAAHRVSQTRSRSPFVAQLLDFFPVESGPSRIVFRQLPCALANSLERGPNFILINVWGVGHQSRHRLAMPRDHDFLAVFDAVEQTPKRVLGFKSADFTNTG